MSTDPQASIEARVAARHLVQRPLVCAEHDAETFRFIRRHAVVLDRWFTQRFGDRVHVDADTARLFKTVSPPADRPMRTTTGRPLRAIEYTLLALALGAVASGPDVISLRDLVTAVRSAAADAEIEMTGDASERRALVTALRWMIANGLLFELHDRIERYADDDQADAVLRVRADRVALLPLPVLGEATSVDDLLRRAAERGTVRQQMRARLANDPVVYRGELEADHWAELRRRLGEESAILDEMLGLELEARAEGVAAIDPTGSLSDRRFPAGGTESHAALLLIDRMVAERGHETESGDEPTVWSVERSYDDVVEIMSELDALHRRRWRSEYAERPDRLADAVIDLLSDLRLLESFVAADGTAWIRLSAAAARFTAAAEPAGVAGDGESAVQDALWGEG